MLQRCGDTPPHEGSDELPDQRPDGERLSGELNAPVERLLKAAAAIGGAHAAAVRRRKFDDDTTHLVAASGIAPEAQSRIARMQADCGVCTESLRDGAMHVSAEACACTAEVDRQGAEDRKVVAIALRYKERTCGVLSFFLDGADGRGELSPELSALLSALGEVVGTAIESTRRADLNVYASVMQERHLLANEVHDSLAQNLTSIRMRTSLLRDAVSRQNTERAAHYLEEIDESLAVAQSRVREIITQFRAQMDAPRLVPALEYAIDELRTASGIEIELINRLREPRLSPYEEVQVFYIAREALTNALKHANPSCVRVVLAQRAGNFELLVEDDGVGLDGGKASDHGHFGLNIMRERAQRLGGRIELERCSGGGTRVHLTFAAHGGIDEAAA
jgi:nitrate/nitrite-specific signal transduction histidine kinase